MNIFSSNLTKLGKIRWWHWLTISLLALGGFLYWAHSNPLYSDEEMIARFHANRSEIEALVKSYQEFRPSPGRVVWDYLPEIKVLQAKAGVKHVSGELPIWFPNPYSMEASRQFDLFIKNDRGSGVHHLRPYETIAIDFLYEREPDRTRGSVLLSSGPQLIFKELIYTPEVPRIENGILLHPADEKSPSVPAWPVPNRVFPSLNEYPPGWNRPGECALRQIEAQWFIRMCIAVL